MRPVLESAIDVNWPPGVTHKKISDVERNYRLQRGVVDGDLSSNVSADVVDELDDIIAQEVLCKTDGGFSFTNSDR